MKPGDPNQWNETAANWRQTNHQTLLRLISDLLNSRLFENWLPETKVERLLKTDLFDESLTEGLCPLLSRHANHVFCMDISLATVIAAKRKYPQLQAIVADVRRLPFAKGTFDIVVSNSTLDHFETPEEIVTSLADMNLVMRNEAELLLTLDNKNNPVIYLRNVLPYRLLHNLGILPYYVGTTFSVCCLKEVLQKLNFSVLDTTAFWHFPRILIVGAAWLIDKFILNKSKEKLLNFILSFESLSKSPTKYLTGQFIAAKAIKRAK